MVHHTATFSKTQNIKDILRDINDCFSGGEKDSLNNSMVQPLKKRGTQKKSSIMNLLEKQQATHQTRARLNLQNFQLTKISPSIFTSSKSREKTPVNKKGLNSSEVEEPSKVLSETMKNIGLPKQRVKNQVKSGKEDKIS